MRREGGGGTQLDQPGGPSLGIVRVERESGHTGSHGEARSGTGGSGGDLCRAGGLRGEGTGSAGSSASDDADDHRVPARCGGRDVLHGPENTSP
jgi:hypothetical protein